MTILLIIILAINVFVMGMLAPYLYRYAMAHFKSDHMGKAEVEAGEQLPPAVKERLIKDSEARFQKVLENSAVYLQHGLMATATDLNALVKQLVTEIINSELENYHQEMIQMRQKAETELSAVKTEMNGHKDELKADLTKEIEAEKQKMINQIDTKLGDAVGSFLVEALGHEVDLGSQNEYLTKLLEEHKAEFAKELASDDAPAAESNKSADKTAAKEAIDDKAQPAA